MLSRKSIQRKITLTFTILCSLIMTTSRGTAGENEMAARIDTSKTYQNVLPERSTWEQVAYFPGRVVYFPIKYTFKGTGALIGFIDDSNIIQRIDDKLESDDGRRKLGFTYSSRTGGGVRYYQNGISSSNLDRNIAVITATSGYEKEWQYGAEFKEIFLFNNKIILDFQAHQQNLSEEYHYDIGMSAPESSISTYSIQQSLVDLQFANQISSNSRLTLNLGFENSEIGAGYEKEYPNSIDIYDESSLPGIHQNVGMIYGKLGMTYSSINHPGNPNQGLETAISAGWYNQVDKSDFGFSHIKANVTKYFHLFYDRVLVWRIAADLNRNTTDRSIPFYYLSTLGHEETIRGYKRGRFRDNDAFITTFEYRYPVWHFWDEKGLDFVLFSDFGQVTPDLFEKLDIDEFAAGYGVGFRLWDWQKGLTAHMHIGWSDEQVRVYLGLN